MPPAERARELAHRKKCRDPIAILVYNVDSTGGMERQAALLARELGRQGRQVVLVSTFFPRSRFGLSRPDPPLHERREGVHIYRVPSFSNVCWDYLTSQNLYESVAAWILHKHQVSLIYSVQAQTGGVHAARLAPVLERPAVVKLACSGAVGDIAVAHTTPQGLAVHDYLRALDRVVYLNDESRDEALAIGVPRERLVPVPNGIDLARFEAEPAPAPLELVLFVGRLDHQKRAHVLLEAFARLAARRPRARLALAGQGPERASLEAQARALGLGDKVAFLGVRGDVPALLRAARVFALPSAEEGQSNALLEALAAGTPAVASDIAGNRALVRPEIDALLVPVDDAPALERALERLLEDPALAARLAAAGRTRVRESYSIESVARRYGALFDSLPRGPRTSFARFFARYVFSRVWGVSGILVSVAREGTIQLAPMAWAALVRGTKRALGLSVAPAATPDAGSRAETPRAR